MQIARSILKLTRIDSSLLIALVIFIPSLVRTKDLGSSLGKAIPLLFISICTFIANDLDDIEKDRLNHPERPLPSGHVKPSFAVVLYFACLASALFATRFYVKPNTAFWYYVLLTLSISYGYVVDCFPGLKSLYVATTIAIPVLIVATSYPDERRLYLVAGSAFFFVLGRELCMDLVDRAGDAASFMHQIRPEPLAIAAFSSQAIGLLLLAMQADKQLLDLVDLLLATSLLVLSSLYWFRLTSYKRAIVLMKAQLFIGLYFLI
jgi:geranylgeranylglycerol-phosphate geranylgeranyltransferase